MITLNFKKADYCLTPCKRIQGSLGILIPRRGFQISGIGFFILDSNLYWDPDSLRRILDSKDLRIRDSLRKLPIRDLDSPTGANCWMRLRNRHIRRVKTKTTVNGMLTTYLRQKNFRVLHQ